MGQSPDATLAWGVVVHDEDWETSYHDAIEELLEHDWDLESLFGFAEPPPWDRPGWPHMSRDESNAARKEWNAVRDAAIPVEFDHFGSYDYGGKILVLKRKAHANWGFEEVGLAALPEPQGPEIAALNKVLDAIGFTGDRTPKLLLFAFYG